MSVVYGCIKRLPISSVNKLRLNSVILDIRKRIKYSSHDYERVKLTNTFCLGNTFYGHEFCLKRYSGFTDCIYGTIEHGLYFGDNRSKVGYEEDYDFGSILTFGDYRMEILKEVFPQYNVVGIGPYIHYAEMDMQYYYELKNRLDPNSRTIALYPDHCANDENVAYDFRKFVCNAMDIAQEIDARNILLSMHPNDIAIGLHKEFEKFGNKNVILVTGGSYPPNYLPRVRAIMSLTDLIFSNDIGTYLGYGVYLNKPVIIDVSSNHRINGSAYKEDQKKFAKVFNGNNLLMLTTEQKELCNYYFGYDKIKTPEALCKELLYCKSFYNSHFK